MTIRMLSRWWLIRMYTNRMHCAWTISPAFLLERCYSHTRMEHKTRRSDSQIGLPTAQHHTCPQSHVSIPGILFLSCKRLQNKFTLVPSSLIFILPFLFSGHQHLQIIMLCRESQFSGNLMLHRPHWTNPKTPKIEYLFDCCTRSVIE